MSDRMPEVGQSLVYHDHHGLPHNALVTTVWGPLCVNLLYVSGDPSRQDNNGRQIERQSSCCHVSMMNVHGNYWRFADEAVEKYHPPVAV